MKEKHMTLFIYGYYGWDNTGDDAMLYTLLEKLPLLYPSADFVVLSRKAVRVPPMVEGKVKFIPRDLLSAVTWLLKSSVFIVGGGTHIYDYGIKKQNLRILTQLWLLFLLARLTGNRVYLVNNGVGPLTTKWGRFLAKSILCMAEKISVRDRASYDTLLSLGLESRTRLGFDLSALLKTTLQTKPAKRILGISVSPAFEIYEGNREKDSLVLDQVVKAIKYNPGWDVWLFVIKGESVLDDFSATMELQGKLKPLKVTVVPYNPDTNKFLDKVGQCSAFVGMRYHACLFAYLSNLPLLVINYHPKCNALAEEIGLAKKGVISLSEILGGQLPRRLRCLMRYPGKFRAMLPLSEARDRADSAIRGIREVEK